MSQLRATTARLLYWSACMSDEYIEYVEYIECSEYACGSISSAFSARLNYSVVVMECVRE